MVEIDEIQNGYQKTQFCAIPIDWKMVSLGEISDIDPDNLPNSTSPDYKFNYISIEDVDKGILRNTTELSFLNAPSRARRKVRKNDVLVSTVRPNLKSHFLIKEIVNDWVCSTGFSVIRCKATLADSGFVFNHFFSSIVNSQIENLISGSNYPAINSKDVRSLQIPIPPTKAEQTAIATVLNDTDALIAGLEKLIAKKRAIKQGAMQELLRPKEGWVEKVLGKTAILKARIGWQGLTTAEYRPNGDYYLITGTEFKDGFIDWESCFYVDEDRYKQDKNIQIKENDVLVTKDGTIGKVAFIKALSKPATLNSGVFVIRPVDHAFLPEFFYYVLLSDYFKIFLSQLSAGSTIHHLYQKDFISFKYFIPKTTEEQKEIAGTLADIDAEIEALGKRLDKYKFIKQGMMQELLTGKIRLI